MENSKPNVATPINSTIIKKLKIPRTFEIMVEEMHEEDDGSIRWRPVMVDPRLGGNGQVTITVNSPAELQDKQQWYERAGQRFKIIREINPPSRADIERIAAEQGIELKPGPAPVKQQASIQPSAAAHSPTQAPAPEKKTVSKIITLGDVQIKYDGDSVYQKQWIQLSPKEAENIRVVSDSNNKLVPMKRRHFEVKRWIKIEGGSVLDESAEEL